ncbi:MAG: GTPase Era [Alphaproteobacteria bacterium]|nr:GTPase Era [Alphaproteobacteria bacterium]
MTGRSPRLLRDIPPVAAQENKEGVPPQRSPAKGSPESRASSPAALPTRCGYVALIGAPNAGKSTLLNQLVGHKLAIVSPKVQTTRSRLLGIVVAGASQLVFVDTPGIFEPRRRLDRAMVAAAWTGAADSDIAVLLVDAAHCGERGIDGDTRHILDRLAERRNPAVLALNKIDLVRRDSLLGLAAELGQKAAFEQVFMISGLTGDGVEDLKRHLTALVPPGPWLFPEDQLSDAPERLIAAEVTREQVFVQLHQELPYAATVETESWEERPDGSARIAQVIYVQRPGQRAIVLGNGGRRIKTIGARARAELEQRFGRRVHLFLFVKVRENWIDDRERYDALGLDYNA